LVRFKLNARYCSPRIQLPNILHKFLKYSIQDPEEPYGQFPLLCVVKVTFDLCSVVDIQWEVIAQWLSDWTLCFLSVSLSRREEYVTNYSLKHRCLLMWRITWLHSDLI
jgi:hypothetical protein